MLKEGKKVIYSELMSAFLKIYGGLAKGIRLFQAPGRINLIGEHIDYNGGHVLPAALDMRTIVAARPNGTRTINMAATSLPDRISAGIGRLDDYRSLAWGNYQCGVAYMLSLQGYPLVG